MQCCCSGPWSNRRVARARDFCLLSVPTVNGYRRLSPEFSLSPTRIGWSFEDRSGLIRVLGDDSSTHIENRLGEPCANPYLTIASQLFAGLNGLLSGLQTSVRTALGDEPGAAPLDILPQSLSEALEAFRSGQAEELLGKPLTRNPQPSGTSSPASHSRSTAQCGDSVPRVRLSRWERSLDRSAPTR